MDFRTFNPFNPFNTKLHSIASFASYNLQTLSKWHVIVDNIGGTFGIYYLIAIICQL